MAATYNEIRSLAGTDWERVPLGDFDDAAEFVDSLCGFALILGELVYTTDYADCMVCDTEFPARELQECAHAAHSLAEEARRLIDALVDRLEDSAASALESAELIDPHADYVYVLQDSSGYPVYIGRSSVVFDRIGSHMQSRDKAEATANVRLLRCGSKAEARELEALLIGKYRPRFNIHLNPSAQKP